MISDRPRSLVVRCAVEPALDRSGCAVVKWFKPGHDLGFVEWASLAYRYIVDSGESSDIVAGSPANRTRADSRQAGAPTKRTPALSGQIADINNVPLVGHAASR